MRMFKSAAIFLLYFVCVALGAQSSTDRYFTTYYVAGKVHMLQSPNAGGNIGVFSGEDGVLILAQDSVRLRMLKELIIPVVVELLFRSLQSRLDQYSRTLRQSVFT